MYIITENGVKTIEDCQNRKQIDNYYKYYYKADFSSLTELLQYCNYDYNACHCDTNGQKLQIDEPRCGNVTNCRAGRDRPGGNICEKGRSTKNRVVKIKYRVVKWIAKIAIIAKLRIAIAKKTQFRK